MGDIFREVDEELKQERYEKLWRRYGRYVISLALVLVLAVAGWKFWENHQVNQRIAEGERFYKAVDFLSDMKTADAAQAFSDLGAQTSSGYGFLSRFYEAALLSESGAVTEAIKVYDTIESEASIPPSMRDLAIILGALNALKISTISSDVITKRIKKLSGPGKPYRHLALEILALCAKRDGDIREARARYEEVANDPEAPDGIRSRAAQMVEILGGGK
ncbi:MAG: tetratricopeptide repeat protein [Pseudomonadota bacterium]|nr:tetratricopeptide repeat protein [Pseudomonadota bacterium]